MCNDSPPAPILCGSRQMLLLPFRPKKPSMRRSVCSSMSRKPPYGRLRSRGQEMSRFIAFLRAINVGGGRTVKMDPLRQLFESLGFSGVTTFIASGNVVFETTTKNAKTLERKIEQRLREALGYDVAAFIRTDAELAEIANYQPFRQSEIDAAAEFNIIFLAETLDEKVTQKVLALRTDTDEFQ